MMQNIRNILKGCEGDLMSQFLTPVRTTLEEPLDKSPSLAFFLIF